MHTLLKGVETYVVLEAGNQPPPDVSPVSVANADELEQLFILHAILTHSVFGVQNEWTIRRCLRSLGDTNAQRYGRVQLLRQFTARVAQGQIRLYRPIARPTSTPRGSNPTSPPSPAVAASRPSEEEFDVIVRFQVCPGDASGLGIANAPYVVRDGAPPGGAEVARGTTNLFGEVPVGRLRRGAHRTVVVFDTQYDVDLHPGVDPISPSARPCDPSIKKRLDTLGYLTGYLTSPVPVGSDSFVDNEEDRPRCEQGLQAFQADHGLASDAVLTDPTKQQLRQSAGA